MKFGRVPLSEAEGSILAHSVQAGSGILKKGRKLGPDELARLAEAGLREIVAARLEPGDIGEDEAAARVARAIAGAGVRVAEPFTGRSNVFAEAPGLVLIDAQRIDMLNRIDEALTVATLPAFERVAAGDMLATVKVITFAVSETSLSRAVRLAEGGLVSLAPFSPKRAGLILTRLAATKSGLLAKRERVMADRLAAAGSALAETLVVAHEIEAVRSAIEALSDRGCDPILVFAASAIVDRGDVVPAAVEAAGGRIVHLGMPVDPGNLLLMARLGTADVIGVPSCAGSPRRNGFDWVLERRLAGLEVTGEEISRMGVGGLLKEIASRPQPREAEGGSTAPRREPQIGCIVLAAGFSSRMGSLNKLTETLAGRPIVRRVVEAALASRARPVVVVTGHEAERVEAALADLGVEIVRNPRFAQGLSSSLKAGLDALPESVDGAMVVLADMPLVKAEHLDRLIAAFAPKEGRSIVVPVCAGRRGNPVLWSADFFASMRRLEGDTGAKRLLTEHAEQVVEVDLGSDAVLTDIDTPEALAELRRKI
ncbi:MAG TPA: molybdopterin-binding/glycosyltransferase family 2 protein [Hyphomicrobiaceae bacterium]|nr:molybdopterin-binding/glycosyltransferase family 2 protein [Hyphomicrobiaceae bacterium]